MKRRGSVKDEKGEEMKELDKILSKTAEQLGITLCFCQKQSEWKASADESFTHTFFHFSFHGEDYVCAVEGTDEASKNYAQLLPTYIQSFSVNGELSKEGYLKKILLGECVSADVHKYVLKYGIKNQHCYVIVLQADELLDDAMSLATQYGGNEYDVAVRLDEKRFALVKYVGEEEKEYRSATDYADFLAQSLKEEIGAIVTVGVGSYVKSMKDLPLSFTQATSAIRNAEVFSGGDGVHSYKEYMLVKMLEDIPKAKLSEYFSELTDERLGELFDDEELISTADEFLRNSFNVTETAKKLYMHRNTLLYRLEKIEKASGLNLREFSEAVSFRLLTILHKLLKG